MPWTYSQLHVASLTFEAPSTRRLSSSISRACVYEPLGRSTANFIHVDDAWLGEPEHLWASRGKDGETRTRGRRLRTRAPVPRQARSQ